MATVVGKKGLKPEDKKSEEKNEGNKPEDKKSENKQ